MGFRFFPSVTMPTTEASKIKLPKLTCSNVGAGIQSFSEDIVQVKFNGTIGLNIEGFLVWSEFKEDNFAFVSKPADFKFRQEDYKFCLHLRLNVKSEDTIGIYFQNLNPKNLKVKFGFMAIDSSGKPFGKLETPARTLPSVETQKHVCGVQQFLSKKFLRENSADYLPNGTLKVQCDFTVYVEEVSNTKNEVQRPNKNFSTNMVDLWHERFLHDFNIKCDGENFPCHKVILASRSDVFKAMLTKEKLLETSNNEVEIKDCTAKTMCNFMEYIYTDYLEDKSDYISTDLMILADKYNVSGLKTECELALSDMLDMSNAVNLLSIASLFSAEILMKRAAGFVASNRQELFASEEWKKMVKTNPQAMEAVIQASL